ncbi:hypothetical protein ACXR2U_11665 [Jatrophihabitans sp. YIM 134969]
MSGSLVVPSRFNGPAQSANGGWVAGLVSRAVQPGLAVRVDLVGSPPLDTDLGLVTTAAGADLVHEGRVLVKAVATDDITVPVPAVDPETATAARARFLEFDAHPFTTCFVCGTDRPDGLQVFPGPVTAGDWTHVATTVVTTEFAGARELPWAALDCPGGWAAGLTSNLALLASYTVRVVDEVEPGETGVLVARDDGPRGASGRARASRSAFYGADGRLVAHADAVWVTPRNL